MLVPSIFSSSFNDGFFDDLFSFPFAENHINHVSGLMNADVEELDDKYLLNLELPGYSKDDIHADLQDGYLTIQAERHESKDEKDKKGKFIRRERYTGQCQRSFYVGDGVKQEDIHAKFENGVLKLEVPKVEQKPEVEQKSYIMIE
ncbi:hypothetical protein lbkm_0050 [Lachnospiraceae bacterium KM106-2]|nr:hypothetical protein lbkm_0050 [Lachnospiraceae bacterium KM106-2]